MSGAGCERALGVARRVVAGDAHGERGRTRAAEPAVPAAIAPAASYDRLRVQMAQRSYLPDRPRLLEREAEVAAIGAAVAGAVANAGRLVVIEGHAGMGKTRLLEEARTTAAQAGVEVLAARAGELEEEFAFGVVRQLFEARLAAAPADDRAEIMAGAASLALQLFEEAQLAAGDSGASDPSFAMLPGLY